MPTYDYECSACGEKLEVFQRMSEAPKKKCPKCGKNKLQRLIGSGAGFIFKGSGFYITDYRSSDYKAKAKADTEQGKTTTPEAGKGGTASAAKPAGATKTEASPSPAKPKAAD